MSYNEQLQRIWRQYEAEHGSAPATVRDVVQWAVNRGLLRIPNFDPYEKLSEHMANALREEYRLDEHGRKYRVNHAITITADGGIQRTIWAVLGEAPPELFERGFLQRRSQIMGACYQLAVDIHAFNEIYGAKDESFQPVQLSFDFGTEVDALMKRAERTAA